VKIYNQVEAQLGKENAQEQKVSMCGREPTFLLTPFCLLFRSLSKGGEYWLDGEVLSFDIAGAPQPMLMGETWQAEEVLKEPSLSGVSMGVLIDLTPLLALTQVDRDKANQEKPRWRKKVQSNHRVSTASLVNSHLLKANRRTDLPTPGCSRRKKANEHHGSW